MRTACLLLGAVLLATSPLRAAEELEFAVPDDGRITLGVFDASGKLVRVLHKLAREEDFRIGDNGLITTWDGKNDTGERMAPGHYHVRGYLIGDDVRVSGENFLFNDWAADDGFPGFSRIKDFALLENGDVVILAEDWPKDQVLARFSSEKGFLWSCRISAQAGPSRQFGSQVVPRGGFRPTDSAGHPLGGSAIIEARLSPPLHMVDPLLAVNAQVALMISDSGLDTYDIENGNRAMGAPSTGGMLALAVAANERDVFVSSNGGLTSIALPDLSRQAVTSPPSTFTSMDADASTLVGASPEGVWIRKETFAPVKLPTAAKSVALGTPDTFWFVGVENETSFVGQASFGGEILRLLRPADGDPKPDKICASRASDKFAVIESLPGVQRLRVMERAESGEWTIEWERMLRESGAFGFADGKPVADNGGAPQDKSLRVRLKENPLTGKHDFLTLYSEFSESGSRLVSPDGLPLVEVSTRNDTRRTAIHRGEKSDTLRLLQGNGSFVEEFSVSGLDDILPLDAGGIDLP